MFRKAMALAAACVIFGSGTAASAAVTFDISGGGYSNIGSGYGCTRSNTLLCVTFTSLIGNPAPFTLSAVGQSRVLTLGSVFLNDRIRDGVDNLALLERDNLGVTAFLNFALPTARRASYATTAFAFPGRYLGDGTDLSLLFAPVVVDLPNGARYSVQFAPLIFTSDPQRLTHRVTVRLLRDARALPLSSRSVAPDFFAASAAEATMQALAVPEPATWTMFILGFGAVGTAVRRPASIKLA